MECPKWQQSRSEMFQDIMNIEDGCGQALLRSQHDILLELLGLHVDGLTLYEQMSNIWYISASHISTMYRERSRQGIG